ncbi:MAG TPA: trehalase family glycosidase [Bacteroidales bacterium]|nr:trehalase family glycosidase [Bacteroidales bacterium]
MKTNLLQSIIFISLVSVIISCSGNRGEYADYLPAYDSLWPAVSATVQQSWDSTITSHPPLPKTYTSVAKGSGIMIYWDTYFINKGLLADGRDSLARNNVDDLMFWVDSIGYVPNSNFSSGFTRSQVPTLSLMVMDIYQNMKTPDTSWLHHAYLSLKKEYRFWTDTTASAIEDHSTDVSGLQRYSSHASEMDLLKMYTSVLTKRFTYPTNVPVPMMKKVAGSFMAEVESGMDFTPRFENRCCDFIPVDLNSYLYLYEMNFAQMVKELGLSGEPDWEKLAVSRKEKLNKYCWDAERGLYMDYDFKNKRFSKTAAVTAFVPLLAGIASDDQAKQTVDHLGLFEYEYGVVPCEKQDKDNIFQWDYPSVMPPLQLLTMDALLKYGYKEDAKRLAVKYLDMVAKNYLYPVPDNCKSQGEESMNQREKGLLWEKYLANGSIDDNVYCAEQQMGWTAGVYEYASKLYDELK